MTKPLLKPFSASSIGPGGCGCCSRNLGALTVPEGSPISVDELVQCLECQQDYTGIQLDGAALAMRLEALNTIRDDLSALFEKYPYVTRLYSTMSPAEMTLDPTFGFNRDLQPIDNIRQAVMRFAVKMVNPTPMGPPLKHRVV